MTSLSATTHPAQAYPTLAPLAVHRSLRRIRILLLLFATGLVISGITAFPLIWEVTLLNQYLGAGTPASEQWPALAEWISRVHTGLAATEAAYSFLFYGTDWLAFAHLTIAVAFYGPYKDPVRNKWVIEFGMIACGMVIPLAFICGPIREIPFYWQLIDCSFGLVGIIPLWFSHREVQRIERLASQ